MVTKAPSTNIPLRLYLYLYPFARFSKRMPAMVNRSKPRVCVYDLFTGLRAEPVHHVIRCPIRGQFRQMESNIDTRQPYSHMVTEVADDAEEPNLTDTGALKRGFSKKFWYYCYITTLEIYTSLQGSCVHACADTVYPSERFRPLLSTHSNPTQSSHSAFSVMASITPLQLSAPLRLTERGPEMIYRRRSLR